MEGKEVKSHSVLIKIEGKERRETCIGIDGKKKKDVEFSKKSKNRQILLILI